MRKYAKLSPRLWTGSVGQAMRGDKAMQALAPYLLGPHSNMSGLFVLRMGYVAEDLGWTVEEVEGALEGLERVGYIEIDRVNWRIWVVQAFEHELGDGNRLKASDKRRKGLISILKDHSVSPLARRFCDHYGLDYEEFVEGSREALDRGFEGASIQEQEQQQYQQQEQEQESDSSAVAADGHAKPATLLVYPTNGKPKSWELTDEQLEDWVDLYPNLDVIAECRKALAWVKATPDRRKTSRGMTRFLTNWLNRATDSGRGVRPQSSDRKPIDPEVKEWVDERRAAQQAS